MTHQETLTLSCGVDFVLRHHGSVALLHPITAAAKAWIDEFMDPCAQRWGAAFVVEPRQVDHLLNGIAGDGLRVRASVDTLN